MTQLARPADLIDRLTLSSGSHEPPPGDTDLPQACLMEAVAWMAGEEWSDAPECVSPVLAIFGRHLNDVVPDARRQELRRFVLPVIGTAGDGQDEARGYLALDWLIRAYTPAWLDLAGLAAEASALRDLRRIVDLAAAQAAGPVVRTARDRAAAAWDAARAAAWDAAGAAARAAAGAAAWDAARAAAWDAAGAAAWAAAGAAAWDAAGAAAWDAAWDAARDAAGAAARDAAWDAAWAAAGERLQPTVDQLQDSAIALYETMISPEEATS